ncbi:glutaredoxin family protein [Candidatus Uabimicrobium sp. HlEnr_7]|uniref:glutaredoxin family protein n=1 Tax=Candidatus Uabimicrobium helgolandensis TaxID=3095367 RepID=UPI0035574CB4
MSRDIQREIKKIIDESKVVLFMKGTPSSPMCRLSANIVMMLKEHGLHDFKNIDILNDFAIREGVKVFSDWPSLPQLYVNGEFIGGSEEVQELYDSGILGNKLE